MNDVLVSRRHIVSPKFGRLGERRFPESRRKAYYLMSIHEHLPPEAKRELKAVGWTKSLELAKLARRDPEHFDCATWLHKAREMPKEQFKQEVEKELNAGETEPWEIIYFKLYRNREENSWRVWKIVPRSAASFPKDRLSRLNP
jgi:hypothetical protein